jgi:hypothetical protein
MAGAGWRQFTVGQLLTSAQVQTFLQDQAVQVFASAAARTSALGTAVSAGMVSYRADDRALELYAGSAWTPVMQGRNAIINGAFEINQRNFTSTVAGAAYTFDRWITEGASAGGTITWSAQTFAPGAAPVAGYEAANYARCVTASLGTLNYAIYGQRIEDVRTFANQTVTASFWARAGSGTPKLGLNFLQSFGAGGSAPVTTLGTPVNLTTSWARYSITVTVPTISGKTIGTSSYLYPYLVFSDTLIGSGVNTQNNTFDVWGVQVEAGSVATPFVRAGGTLQGELAACQRYYFRLGGDRNYQPLGFGMSTNSTSSIEFVIQHPVSMRTAPASVESSSLVAYDQVGLFALSSITIGSTDVGRNASRISAVGTGMTAFRPSTLLTNNTLNGFIAFSAEL